jgi:hypothetical protein
MKRGLLCADDSRAATRRTRLMKTIIEKDLLAFISDLP